MKERRAHLGGGLIALRRVLGDRLHDDSFRRRRDLRPDRAERRRRLMYLHHRHRDERVAIERHLPGQRLIEHDAEAVEIGSPVERMMQRLLGREIVRGAHHRLGTRQLRCPRGAGDAEIRHLGDALGMEQDIMRLDVPVDEATAMGRCERGGDLRADRQRLASGSAPRSRIASFRFGPGTYSMTMK